MTNVKTFTGTYQPTKQELNARTNLFKQLIRFAALNFRMLKMITQGHH